MSLTPPTKRPRAKKEKIPEPKIQEVNSEESDQPSIVETDTIEISGNKKIEEEILNSKLKYEGPPFLLHEIECLCFSRIQQSLAHDAHGRRIDVFSLIDEDGAIIPSTIQCEDCGRKWIITDVDDYDLTTIESLPTYTRKRLQRVLPPDISHVCDEFKISTAMMAYIQWIFEEKKWGTQVLLSSRKYRREDISYETKILIINGPANFSIRDMKTSDIAELY